MYKTYFPHPKLHNVCSSCSLRSSLPCYSNLRTRGIRKELLKLNGHAELRSDVRRQTRREAPHRTSIQHENSASNVRVRSNKADCGRRGRTRDIRSGSSTSSTLPIAQPSFRVHGRLVHAADNSAEFEHSHQAAHIRRRAARDTDLSRTDWDARAHAGQRSGARGPSRASPRASVRVCCIMTLKDSSSKRQRSCTGAPLKPALLF